MARNLRIGKWQSVSRTTATKKELLYWQGTHEIRLYILTQESLRSDLIEHFHNSAHLGKDKTYNRMASYAYWPHMVDDIARYIASCHDCQAIKIPYALPAGELYPHEVPELCWEVITTDFLTEIPTSKRGFDSILVVVDKLSKRGFSFRQKDGHST